MSGFFAAPQGAAVLKHGILRRYLPVFATMTGSRAGEVVYLDAYAGPGLYNDGTPGSPALALTTAQVVAGYKGKATLHGHLIEEDNQHFQDLAALLAEYGATWDLHHGRAEDHILPILSDIEPTTPLFAFLDPFGLPIPFDMVQDILRRGRSRSGFGGAATEVLLNFSIPAMNRVGGQLTGRGTSPRWLRARDTMVAHMDQVLGGDWWQAIWRSGAADRIDQIRTGYKDRLRATGNWAVFDIDVADRWGGAPSYHLFLFTQHEDGVWRFHETLSSAEEEYRTYCHDHEGLLDLEPLKDREARWTSTITDNVERILAEGKQFKPVRRISDVYRGVFGEARQKHLRKAIERLHAAGKTSTNPKGVNDLSDLWIKPP
ncbi:MAG: three-Cys-motif partner protein TcmP [Actinomycetota bacterium]